MDDRRFDHLSRSFARSGSRRTLIKGLLGLGGIATMGAIARQDEVRAARRPAPTPAPVTCPGTQVWGGSACICTAGTICGPTCCTGASQCCDNACCNGTCYGEELCCPAGQLVCNGQCLPPGACCTDADCQGGRCLDSLCVPFTPTATSAPPTPTAVPCREGAAECVVPEGGTSILLCIQGTWQEFDCIGNTTCLSNPEGNDFCEITT